MDRAHLVMLKSCDIEGREGTSDYPDEWSFAAYYTGMSSCPRLLNSAWNGTGKLSTTLSNHHHDTVTSTHLKVPEKAPVHSVREVMHAFNPMGVLRAFKYPNILAAVSLTSCIIILRALTVDKECHLRLAGLQPVWSS